MSYYSKRIIIRVSPEQLEFMEKKRKETGIINLSTYIRKMAIDGYVFVVDTSSLREILHLSRICSNNMNQYAKKANETGSIYLEDINDIKEQQKKIYEAVMDIYFKLSDVHCR